MERMDTMEIARATDTVYEVGLALVRASCQTLPDQWEYEALLRQSRRLHSDASRIQRLAKALNRRVVKAQREFDRQMLQAVREV